MHETRQAVLDAVERVAVPVRARPAGRSCRARTGSGRCGAASAARAALGEHRRDGDPREVVVGERGVADVGRDQDLLLAVPLDHELRVGQVARLERRVDHDLVVARLQARAAACGRGRSPRCARSTTSGRGSGPAARGGCAAARAARPAGASRAPARCRRRRAASSRGSRRRGCRPASAMYASRRFHSSGTIQSNTRVPLGISVRVIGICSSRTSKVARTPSPVRLRQSGNSRRISS